VRGWLYDRALLPLTSGWYAEVLGRMPTGARILDVGIGTAGALLSQKDAIVARDLHVVGVDIDIDYVRRARRKVDRAGLSDRVEVRHEALMDHAGRDYDAVYFAASFMLFDDPAVALEHAVTRLAPGGHVFFTQTFHDRRSPLVERLKPALVKLTSIDFGRVTYEEEFLQVLQVVGLDVAEHRVLDTRRSRSSRLVIARPT